MDVTERNAEALNAEQIRQRQQVATMTARIEKLEAIVAAQAQDLQMFKTIVLPRIMGSGSTAE